TVVGVSQTGLVPVTGVTDAGFGTERLRLPHLPALGGAVAEDRAAVDARGERGPGVGVLRYGLLPVAEVEHDVLVLGTVLVVGAHALLEFVTGIGDGRTLGIQGVLRCEDVDGRGEGRMSVVSGITVAAVEAKVMMLRRVPGNSSASASMSSLTPDRRVSSPSKSSAAIEVVVSTTKYTSAWASYSPVDDLIGMPGRARARARTATTPMRANHLHRGPAPRTAGMMHTVSRARTTKPQPNQVKTGSKIMISSSTPARTLPRDRRRRVRVGPPA